MIYFDDDKGHLNYLLKYRMLHVTYYYIYPGSGTPHPLVKQLQIAIALLSKFQFSVNEI